MKKLKGIGLLILANFLIFITLSITFTLLSELILPAFGIDIRGMVTYSDLLWALVLGFGGAFLSLAFSKQLARAMVGECSQITTPRTPKEAVVYETVHKLANKLDIAMPEVWVYDSPDPNAFATGPSKNNSMVAVSRGLLDNLNEGEIRAVLAHEMGHVYNGDMFTTTILQGLMNTFVYFISRLIYRQLAERNELLAFGVYMALHVGLSLLATIPISWFSRHREFAADRFAAFSVGKEYMISALRAIDRWIQQTQFQYATDDALAAMKISGPTWNFSKLFATHPPIEERIAALERL
ncbi:MAG: protease HtpX [Nitrospirae bacterium]|nr:MAG: protease HtpX [Nitrospirota bacterium]